MSPVDLVQQSFGRAIGRNVFDHFYDIFLASDPDLPVLFAKTEMTQQKHLLRHGINLSILFAKESLAGQSGLNRLRETHSPARMNINPRYYPKWKESFLGALEIADPKFDSAARAAWDAVLQQTIDHMSS